MGGRNTNLGGAIMAQKTITFVNKRTVGVELPELIVRLEEVLQAEFIIDGDLTSLCLRIIKKLRKKLGDLSEGFTTTADWEMHMTAVQYMLDLSNVSVLPDDSLWPLTIKKHREAFCVHIIKNVLLVGGSSLKNPVVNKDNYLNYLDKPVFEILPMILRWLAQNINTVTSFGGLGCGVVVLPQIKELMTALSSIMLWVPSDRNSKYWRCCKLAQKEEFIAALAWCVAFSPNFSLYDQPESLQHFPELVPALAVKTFFPLTERQVRNPNRWNILEVANNFVIPWLYNDYDKFLQTMSDMSAAHGERNLFDARSLLVAKELAVLKLLWPIWTKLETDKKDAIWTAMIAELEA